MRIQSMRFTRLSDKKVYVVNNSETIASITKRMNLSYKNPSKFIAKVKLEVFTIDEVKTYLINGNYFKGDCGEYRLLKW